MNVILLLNYRLPSCRQRRRFVRLKFLGQRLLTSSRYTSSAANHFQSMQRYLVCLLLQRHESIMLTLVITGRVGSCQIRRVWPLALKLSCAAFLIWPLINLDGRDTEQGHRWHAHLFSAARICVLVVLAYLCHLLTGIFLKKFCQYILFCWLDLILVWVEKFGLTVELTKHNLPRCHFCFIFYFRLHWWWWFRGRSLLFLHRWQLWRVHENFSLQFLSDGLLELKWLLFCHVRCELYLHYFLVVLLDHCYINRF